MLKAASCVRLRHPPSVALTRATFPLRGRVKRKRPPLDDEAGVLQALAGDYFITAYLKFGASVAKIGVVTLSLIDQTITWWCSGR